MKKKVGILLVALMLLSTVAVGSAEAWSSSFSKGQNDAWGHGMRTWVASDYYNWGCGAKDCASTDNMRGGAYYRSWADKGPNQAPNRVQMRMVAGFSGVGLSVGVSKSGVSASFSDWGTSCGQGWVANNHTRISYRTSGEICKASSWAWISKVYAKTESQYRLGWNWYGSSAYTSARIGGF